ncbi:MAG: hypothetical protein AB7L66_14605 [Gemmatimonadales bacterium]
MSAPTAPPDATEPPPYFAVGLLKLSAMMIVTFGAYAILWSYHNWSRHRTRTGEDVNPLARAIFAPLMAYSLFTRISEDLEVKGLPGFGSPLVFGIGFFALSASGRLPDPWWLVSLLAFLPLLPVQYAVNRANATVAPQANPNRSFSFLNVVGIGAGVLALASLASDLDLAGATTEPATITATNGTSRIDVPAGWAPAELSDEADLEVANRRTGLYLIVLTESKGDFAPDFTYLDHANRTVRGMLESMTSAAVVGGPDTILVNGRPAVQSVIEGRRNGIRIVYLHTTVDGEGVFHQIIGWGVPSAMGAGRRELVTVIKSFVDLSRAKPEPEQRAPSPAIRGGPAPAG